MQRESGERTLRASVLLSAPGPLVWGWPSLWALLHTVGRLYPPHRRAGRHCGVLCHRRLAGEPDAAHRSRLERTARLGSRHVPVRRLWRLSPFIRPATSRAMCCRPLSLRRWVWRSTATLARYRRLNKQTPDAILDVQSRLYRAKTLVDGCVAAALTVVALSPGTPAARAVDLGGSLVVAAYLFLSGLSNLKPDGSPSRP